MMTDAGKVLPDTQKLRVAPPYRRNCATFDAQGATEGATEGATTGLKAAALRVLERNQGRNPSATEAENRRNFYPEKTVQKLRPQMHELSNPTVIDRATLEALHPAIVEGVPLSLVLDEADPEDYADLADPAVLEAFARSLVATGTLKPEDLAQPEPAPRPAPSTVRCCECAHFEPDTIGDGLGIGRCAASAWRLGQSALYPWALRRCASYEPQQGGDRRSDQRDGSDPLITRTQAAPEPGACAKCGRTRAVYPYNAELWCGTCIGREERRVNTREMYGRGRRGY